MTTPAPITFSDRGSRLRAPHITTLMAAALENPALLSLAAGFTDTASLPAAEVAAAAVHLAAREKPPQFLQYGTNQGRPGLREILARRTALQDGAPEGTITPARTIIGNGSQQLLHLALDVLCDPGDIALVERPTYFIALEMLEALGVRAEPLDTHPDGAFDIDAIAARLASLRARGELGRVRALYLVSWFANPSGHSRTAAEKERLAGVLREAGVVVPVIEDAAYRDLWFRAPWPAPSVLAGSAWEDFPRLYLGTLTKPYACGLKVGYAHASEDGWFGRVAWLKGHQDFGTAHFNQAILEEVLIDGGFDRHLQRVRPLYAAKMARLSDALERGGLRARGWSWTLPEGGLCLWLRGPAGIDTGFGGPLWRAALREGVLYVPGGLCFAGPADVGCVRLSFGVLDGAPLDEAARRFTAAALSVDVG